MRSTTCVRHCPRVARVSYERSKLSKQDADDAPLVVRAAPLLI